MASRIGGRGVFSYDGGVVEGNRILFIIGGSAERERYNEDQVGIIGDRLVK